MTSFLLQLRGTYTDAINATEVWQCGIRMWFDSSVPDNSGTFPALDVALSDDSVTTSPGTAVGNWDIDGLVNGAGYLSDSAGEIRDTFFQSPDLFTGHTLLTSLRFYPIDTLGKVVQVDETPAVAQFTYSTPGQGVVGGNMLPLEVSPVLSFQTYKDTPKGRGRIYLPAGPVASIGPTGRFTSSYATTVRDAGAQLLSDLAVESPGPTAPHARPVVTGPSDWNKYSVIKTVRVGDVPDAQRRRRNRVLETYLAEDVDYG